MGTPGLRMTAPCQPARCAERLPKYHTGDSTAPATYTPSSKNLEIEYTDDGFESVRGDRVVRPAALAAPPAPRLTCPPSRAQGATWTATANVGLDDGDNILDAASVSVKRSWTW